MSSVIEAGQRQEVLVFGVKMERVFFETEQSGIRICYNGIEDIIVKNSGGW